MSIYAPKKPSKFNRLNFTIAAVFLVLGYFGWWYLPAFYKVWTVTGAMASESNAAYRTLDDNKLVERLVAAARRVGLNTVGPDNFAIQRDPPTDAQLSMATNDASRELLKKRGSAITIVFAVTLDLPWPLIGGSVQMDFERVRTAEMTALKY
jgi:hypothetical protein